MPTAALSLPPDSFLHAANRYRYVGISSAIRKLAGEKWGFETTETGLSIEVLDNLPPKQQTIHQVHQFSDG
jgi:hypothetical protein